MLFFFKFKFIYFNWRLITLQYCIGFAIHQHESAMGVHMLRNITMNKASGGDGILAELFQILKYNVNEWGTRVYLWRIHVDVWQNQYNIVK